MGNAEAASVLSVSFRLAVVFSDPSIPDRSAVEGGTMTIADVEQIARIVAIATGIIFGAAAISTVSWVWLRQQIFAYGGSALSVTGIILIGLSIYKTVDVRAAPDGIGLKLAEVEQLLKEQGEAQKATQVKLAQLPSDIGPKITQLDKTLKDQGAAWTTQFKDFQTANSSSAMYTTGNLSPVLGDLNGRTTAPIKMNIVKSDDGKTSMMVFAPDFKDPKYLEQIKSEIAAETAKYGNSHVPLVNLYMNLGEAYQAMGQKAEALRSYEEGIAILKKN
jgi:hypothetical protein